MADYTNGVKITGYADTTDIKRSEYLGGPPRVVESTMYELEELFPTLASIGLDTPMPKGIGFFYPNVDNPTDSITFGGATFPRSSNADRPQTVIESASGIISVYDNGWVDGTIEILLRQITEAKRKRMYCFFMNIVKKSMYAFDYVERSRDYVSGQDELVYRVRLISKFNPSMPYWGRNDLTLTLRKEQ